MKIEHPIQIKGIAREPNLVSRFHVDDLTRIGEWCWQGFEKDEGSRGPWLKRMNAAMDLALQLQKEKSYPWPGASNVAFPLITIAALQFHSRAYPALISGTDVVKYRVPRAGAPSPLVAKAKLVGEYMSYQCLEEDQGWEEQHDRLLIHLPIVGCCFVKGTYSARLRHNVTELVTARDLSMDYFSKSVDSATRKTQILPPTSRNEVWEKCKSGAWKDITKEDWYSSLLPFVVPGSEAVDKRAGKTPPVPDDTSSLQFLEQHCWMDADGDGYAEPYIITLEATRHEVVRIVARWETDSDIERNARGEVVRINATEHFTKYGLIPSPDNSVYDLGFGILLGPLNESVNSLVNIIVDTGHLAAAGGGFLARGAKLRGGDFVFTPGRYNRVDASGDDVRKAIVEVARPEPAQVLFTLLTFLVNYTQRISGSTDPLAGENPGQNTPKANMDTMVEQGSKIYSALFKRIWRCMKQEFGKLYVLNAKFMPVEGKPWAGTKVAREHFLDDPSQVCPVADPNVESKMIRLQKAMHVADRAQVVPGYDREATERNLLTAMDIDGVEVLFPGPDKAPPLPNPKVALEQAKVEGKKEIEKMKQSSEDQRFLLDLLEQRRVNDAEIIRLTAEAEKLKAEAHEAGASKQIALIDAMIGAAKLRQQKVEHITDTVMQAMQLEVAHKEADAALIEAKKPEPQPAAKSA